MSTQVYDKVYVPREGMEEGWFIIADHAVRVTPKEIHPAGGLKEPEWLKPLSGYILVPQSEYNSLLKWVDTEIGMAISQEDGHRAHVFVQVKEKLTNLNTK